MAKINPTIFRRYDVRGIYPDDLNEQAVYRITRAMAEFYPQSQKMVVACDPRLSSPALTETIIKALQESGKEVIDIGISPDPLFYFSIIHYDFDGGIMISGSHSPKEYNGLMLAVKKPDGDRVGDIIGEDLERIKKRVLDGRPFTEAKEPLPVKEMNPTDDYINYVSEKIKLKKPLKIIIDTANGACGYLPEKIFKKLGCDVKTFYAQPDGTFPNHLPDPYREENLIDIKKAVIEKKADIGFAFDTDGDRVMPIDNQGRQVSGDFCMLMLARQAMRKKKGPVVHEARISKAFLDEMEKQGIETYFSVAHHNAVIDKIVEHQAVFGGEITLHFFFPIDYYLCDDAVFSALKIAEVASSVDDFAMHIDDLPHYTASPELFVKTTDQEKFKLVDGFVNYLKENNYNFIDVDGARINFANGWALVRVSNTSPMIKCRFEGETKEDLIEIEKKIIEIFKKVGIPITDKNYKELGLIFE